MQLSFYGVCCAISALKSKVAMCTFTFFSFGFDLVGSADDAPAATLVAVTRTRGASPSFVSWVMASRPFGPRYRRPLSYSFTLKPNEK